MNFDLIRPCADCPFRSDRPFYLGRERREEMVARLVEYKLGGAVAALIPVHRERGDEEE